MKTLFADNEIFATSIFDVLTSDELSKVKGGGPIDRDLYFEEEDEEDDTPPATGTGN